MNTELGIIWIERTLPNRGDMHVFDRNERGETKQKKKNPAEIQTDYFTNTSLERYRYDNQIGPSAGFGCLVVLTYTLLPSPRQKTVYYSEKFVITFANTMLHNP
jgi:hypothetical protein